MKLQDFRVGFRILARNPAYSLLSVLGLGVGVAVCLLLLGYARYSWQYNSHVPEAGQVYLVKHRDNLKLGTPWYDQAPLLLLSAVREAPGVASASGYVGWLPLTLELDGELRNLKSLTVLPGFAEIMGLKALKGDLDEALSRPDSIAVTQGTAVRLFGTADALGKTLQLRLSAVDENRSTARIAAILPDPPTNTTIAYEILSGPNLGLVPPVLRDELLGQSRWLGYLLVRLQPGVSPAEVSEFLQRAADVDPAIQRISPERREQLGGRKVMDIELSSLREAYFDRDVATNFLSIPVDRGDAGIVNGLVAVAFLILALAAVNYANLATLRLIRRQREIATRKVLGASHARLAVQFIAESLLVSLFAVLMGLGLAVLAYPVFSELMARDLGPLLTPGNIGIALGLGMLLGLVTAIYPVWMAFGVRPSLLLVGRPDTESARSRSLRQLLSVLQVAAAMGLASFTLAIAWQARFAIDSSPGFDPTSLLVLDLPKGASARDEKARGLMAELSQQPAVAGVAVSNDAIGRSHESWSTEIRRDDTQEAKTIDVKSVSTNFFDEYRIRPVAGRLFDASIDKEGSPEPIVLNEIAARQLGFASPQLALGQTLQFNSFVNDAPAVVIKRIVGIAPEVRFRSLREEPSAIAYELWGSGGGWDGTLTVRASGSVADAERVIRDTWPRYYPNSVIELKPAKAFYAANYADDARLAKLLACSTAIAMIIAAFGLYVLSTDAVQRRTREIALRKLFGTARRDIGKLIAREIGAVILISALVALPLAALAISRHLANYTERTPWAWWALVFAFLATLAIAAIAGARQAWIAMALKPAVALRS